MSNYFIKKIYEKNRSMMNLEKSLNLYYLFSQTILLGVPGEVIELGCYRGLSAILLQKTLDNFSNKKQLHIYDSFEGLPEKTKDDVVVTSANMRKCDYLDNHRIGKGWFHSTREELIENFRDFQVKIPIIHEGWFALTLKENLPSEISFAHIDGDLYQSTIVALEEVYPRMSIGAIAVIDDYCDELVHERQNSLPGVKLACDSFFKDKCERVEVLVAGNSYQGFFQKK